MRLANRALIAALAMLVLCAAVSAQTLRSPNDPRNQSPSVGTGGPGGPTGLFTIYDGSTIRKGEFTPSGPNVGTLARSSLFRPFNNQPFPQSPFIGGSAGDLKLGPGFIGTQFGFPGFNALIGTPTPEGRA